MTDAKIAVLMTCFNRRALTLACLATLAGQDGFDPSALFLVDDGSSDGTGDAVREAFPEAQVIQGTGSLFWNGGMRLAWDTATRDPRSFDFYLWLNDDVALADGTLAMMVADADAMVPRGGPVIVAAAANEPGEPDTITYGAHRRPSASNPLRLNMVKPTGKPEPVDTISGNMVLVSASAQERLGNMDPRFVHIYGDLDYGFRAGESGVPMYLASRSGGTCAANPVTGSLDSSQPRLVRLRQRWAEEGKLHAQDWRRFVAIHAGGPSRA
ncbi:glycosyltransferase family 2 protein [Croceicoccus sp. YJ47]|uniref:glycosyltransferase family 2 protein n=1 Tax=Croceicoccus sp. YJ47 TaxID=2798724 RepID=UPI001922D4C3|nr:glycosyltransferase family 2 protein [Croceicoccus sp. YJ47]QQN72997.1 glycosyltransferase family 2 protein [Croceicoccus sp. YJ47]